VALTLGRELTMWLRSDIVNSKCEIGDEILRNLIKMYPFKGSWAVNLLIFHPYYIFLVTIIFNEIFHKFFTFILIIV
jgi:hypothetical protein